MGELAFIWALVALTIFCLSGLLVWSHFSWMKHTQVLVNKLMSQNYRDYAIGVVKEKNEQRPPKVQEVAPEDLRTLQEFNFN